MRGEKGNTQLYYFYDKIKTTIFRDRDVLPAKDTFKDKTFITHLTPKIQPYSYIYEYIIINIHFILYLRRIADIYIS